jgi:salicylate hydroxylase
MLFPGTSAAKSGASFHRALVPHLSSSNLDQDCVTVWMVQGGHVVHYAVGNPQLMNVIAICPEGTSPLSHFRHAAPALIELINHAAPHFTIWPALYVRPLSKWTLGNTLLLGDAAHGSLPYMAQGAAMALEDAACLSEALTNTQSFRHAFAETASRRLARTRRLHVETLRTGRVYHAGGPARLIRNFALSQLPIHILMKKLDWLYKE